MAASGRLSNKQLKMLAHLSHCTHNANEWKALATVLLAQCHLLSKQPYIVSLRTDERYQPWYVGDPNEKSKRGWDKRRTCRFQMWRKSINVLCLMHSDCIASFIEGICDPPCSACAHSECYSPCSCGETVCPSGLSVMLWMPRTDWSRGKDWSNGSRNCSSSECAEGDMVQGGPMKWILFVPSPCRGEWNAIFFRSCFRHREDWWIAKPFARHSLKTWLELCSRLDPND